MSTSPSAVIADEEKTPLLANNHRGHHHDHTIQEGRVSICRPRSDISTTDTNSGPCSKYGNEDGMTTSAIHNSKRAKRKLIIACVICLFFLIGEFAGK